MVSNQALDNIKLAFKKVKEDNMFLLQKIEALEQQMKAQRAEFSQALVLIQEKMDLEKAQEKLERAAAASVAPRVEIKENNNDKLSTKKFRANTQSKLLHTMTCPFGKRIKDDHTAFFKSLDLAKKEGYSFCSCLDGYESKN